MIQPIVIWIVFVLAGCFVGFAAIYRRFFVQWRERVRGRDWPTISAMVDVVSVVPQTMQGKGGESIVGYLATLTYFYRNPELQMGECCRMFDPDDEADAQAWAASYKGQTVMVHVDPRDPSRSVLEKEDIWSAGIGRPPAARLMSPLRRCSVLAYIPQGTAEKLKAES